MSFGQADTRFVRYQRAMIEARNRQAQRAIKQQLPRGACQKIRAPHHFRNSHRGIVHHAGQLICRHIVRPPNHEISKIFSGRELLRTQMAVDKGHRFAVWHAETPAEFATRQIRSPQRPASAWIDRFAIILGMWCVSSCLKIFARTRARINKSAQLQFFQCHAIVRITLALIIRRERSADIRPFLPIEAEPPQVFEYRGSKLRLAARAVQVLVAQDQHAPRRSRPLLGHPESSRVSQMQIACGRRRNAAAIGRVLCQIHQPELTTKSCNEKDLIHRILFSTKQMSPFAVQRTYI
jgi:hypothetical protein